MLRPLLQLHSHSSIHMQYLLSEERSISLETEPLFCCLRLCTCTGCYRHLEENDLVDLRRLFGETPSFIKVASGPPISLFSFLQKRSFCCVWWRHEFLQSQCVKGELGAPSDFKFQVSVVILAGFYSYPLSVLTAVP